MELKDIIYKRQSVREYTDAEIPKEDILKILDAGRVAPSGKNCQNWHFVVIRERDLRNKIGQAILDKNEEIAVEMDRKDPEKGLRFRKFVRRFTLFGMEAPVLIAVYATEYKPDGWAELTFAEYPQDVIDELYIRNPGMQSIGAAVENMTLTAIDLGYGSCWMSGHSYACWGHRSRDQTGNGVRKGKLFPCLPASHRRSRGRTKKSGKEGIRRDLHVCVKTVSQKYGLNRTSEMRRAPFGCFLFRIYPPKCRNAIHLLLQIRRKRFIQYLYSKF